MSLNGKDGILGTFDWPQVGELVKKRYMQDQRKHIKQLTTSIMQNPIVVQLVRQNQLARSIVSISSFMQKYDDPEAHDDVIDIIAESNIYSEVEKKQQTTELESDLGYTDILVKELLRWFKEEFFTWVNKPQCPYCGNDVQDQIKPLGGSRPNKPEHHEGKAQVIENYKCEICSEKYEFPRYNNPRTLLKTRKGRCGEWDNCFVFILRALQIPVRYLWNVEDHVWCEYYSTKMKRWIHLDCCENAFDNPLLYSKGWGKKMSYVFAVSSHYVVDVSSKYIEQNSDKQLPRNKIDSKLLAKLLFSCSGILLEKIHDDNVYLTTLAEIMHDYYQMHKNKIMPTITENTGSMAPRQSGAGSWTESRGENGSN